MSDREKIAHLLRRLGLGAGKVEVDAYASLGLDGAMDRLIEYEKVDEGYPVSPWEFCAQPDGQLMFDPFRFAAWWGLRMLLTRRPLQERLTLFWHDHFAVSGAKVFDGPSMVKYLDTLRRHASGSFEAMLKDVSREPAMLYWLDNAQSIKDQPNENFARELLELFTMGSGYTEKDIQEVARAFTGWSVHFGGVGDETPFYTQQERAARKNRSIFSFCFVPEFHDAGGKTVLGKSGAFDGDAVLEMLAKRPETARYLTAKLWEWFAYSNPEPKVRDRLARVFLDGGFKIKPVVRAIAESDEFWSDRCVRARSKSPVDFSVSLFRALGLRDVVLSLRGSPADAFKPLRREVRGAGEGLTFLMNAQGLLLLFPPDVGGWEWGDSWITSNSMRVRIQHADMLFWGDDPNRPIAAFLANRIKRERAPQSAGEVVDALLEAFDAQVPAKARDTLIEACARAGGPGALDARDSAAGMLASVCRMLFAAPEFQVC
jgi:uncharacterized protein (DUF1800 family)